MLRGNCAAAEKLVKVATSESREDVHEPETGFCFGVAFH